MKKMIFLFALIFGGFVLHAQFVQQGNSHLYYERYNTAEASFHQALQKEAGNVDAWHGLTRAYLHQGEIDKAADSLSRIPEALKSDPFYMVSMGAVKLFQDDKQTAADLFAAALKATRNKNSSVMAAIGWAHTMAPKGDGLYAIEMLQKAIKRDKNNEWLYVMLGDAYRKLYNGTEAYKAYHTAIQKNKKHAAAYHKVGEIFLTQRNRQMYTDYFQQALEADPNYAPSLYQLYVYNQVRDPEKAMALYKRYQENSERSIQNHYDMADLLYLNKNYEQAIERARTIVKMEAEKTQPRIYKLIAYSLAGTSDTTAAMEYMNKYFKHGDDSIFIAKDYETMASFYASRNKVDSAIAYFEKAVELEPDSSLLYPAYKNLADLAKDINAYETQARWLGKYYMGNDQATNLDLFNWGLAHYRAEQFQMADSVFGMYSEKYPEQGFGYYWRARSLAMQDSTMAEGLAIPVYQKLISVLEADTTGDATNKKWLIESYGYMAAYMVNTEKNYTEAINYFQKILAIDPENGDARRYIALLQKDVEAKGNDN